MTTDIISVFAGGKITRAEAGQRAGNFGGTGSDFVVKNGTGGMKYVDSQYLLQAGDSLFVTARGVAGRRTFTQIAYCA